MSSARFSAIVTLTGICVFTAAIIVMQRMVPTEPIEFVTEFGR